MKNEIRNLTVEEIDSVGAAGTNWNAVNSTIALIGIASVSTVAAPAIAIGAAGMGIYAAYSSWA